MAGEVKWRQWKALIILRSAVTTFVWLLVRHVEDLFIPPHDDKHIWQICNSALGASNENVSTYKIIKPQLKHIYYSRAVRVKESQIPVCECQPFIGQCILFFHDESWHFNILLTELSTETNRRWKESGGKHGEVLLKCDISDVFLSKKSGSWEIFFFANWQRSPRLLWNAILNATLLFLKGLDKER